MKKTVSISNAPVAAGPYSQAVWSGDFLYCSGQLGLVPESGALAGPDVTTQAIQALKNVLALLSSQGLTSSDVVKATIFLTDMAGFKEVNEAYGRVFNSDPPARTCVEVSSLPLGGLVEIEIIARK
ncbi:MAG: Rid family detoxifying hydrolase [Synergistaceae bacterium]|jgi:2-iminobutanoate/2-iminopropanoate deaminase|nr:Rid family detoxifying hydrolase [Synergistaceae bacterium]